MVVLIVNIVLEELILAVPRRHQVVIGITILGHILIHAWDSRFRVVVCSTPSSVIMEPPVIVMAIQLTVAARIP
jgi:hypothetical protein